MLLSGWAFLSAMIIGAYFTIKSGPFTLVYLISPGEFKAVPTLYFPSLPSNLILFGGFAFWLLKKYRARALPMFFFCYCMWDMLSMPLGSMPAIYAIVYVGILCYSYILARPKSHVVNKYTILVLFYEVRNPIMTLVPAFLQAWYFPMISGIGYDLFFFLFVAHSFSPFLGSKNVQPLSRSPPRSSE
jgi:hypothetical protein